MKKSIIHINYDFFYSSVFFFKFINRLLKCGKRNTIEKIVYGLFKSLEFINIFYKKNIYKTYFLPIYVYFEALSICRPLIGVRIFKPSSKFKKGKKKNKKQIALSVKVIPLIISRQKSYKIAIGWIIEAIKNRFEVSLKKRIIGELKDIILEKHSYSLKKKEQLRALLIVNRSLLHYRWK